MRLGLHTGEPAVGDEGYTGLDVVRASRIAAVGRGGQVLLSETTSAIVAGDLPEGVELHALGDQRLRDIDRPEPLHELLIDDVPTTPAAATSDPELPAIPDLATAMPGWLKGPMGMLGERTSELIERRVLAELNEAFTNREAGVGRRRLPKEPPAGPKRSVSDEIGKLRQLRDAGALTDEQYARAVDRAIEGGAD
jgi:hypothetical protein